MTQTIDVNGIKLSIAIGKDGQWVSFEIAHKETRYPRCYVTATLRANPKTHLPEWAIQPCPTA
jgi:hypothetical protein